MDRCPSRSGAPAGAVWAAEWAEIHDRRQDALQYLKEASYWHIEPLARPAWRFGTLRSFRIADVPLPGLFLKMRHSSLGDMNRRTGSCPRKIGTGNRNFAVFG